MHYFVLMAVIHRRENLFQY